MHWEMHFLMHTKLQVNKLVIYCIARPDVRCLADEADHDVFSPSNCTIGT